MRADHEHYGNPSLFLFFSRFSRWFSLVCCEGPLSRPIVVQLVDLVHLSGVVLCFETYDRL